MRLVPFAISAIVTGALIFALNKKWGAVPPMGKFLSPQHGFWQNAESSDKDFSSEIQVAGVKGNVNVYLDERLVPHVFAENDDDVYFVQGYLHAKFRLWQMEFQVFAAAGMVSQVIGEGKNGAYLKYDRSMRRLGMIYAAEKALKEAENNPVTKAMMDAYTAGVNAYIGNLSQSQLPLEYKLLDYTPQLWTNLKTALYTKYLSYTLAGHDDDLVYTNAKNVFSFTDFEELYPIVQDSLKPVVPVTTESPYPLQPAMNLSLSASNDSAYFQYGKDSAMRIENILPMPDKENGSNNWAIAPSKTAGGNAILCNDPHLGLNLPSIWYEMQITTPSFNAYGVSFPGAPNIVIGFNDSIAFGFTNAGRDVKDYYEIKFKDAGMNEYWYDSAWVKTEKRVEIIQRRGSAVLYDTIAYTVFGPVIYDHSFPIAEGNQQYYAVRWKAHDPSNELMLFHGLNRANNYDEYVEAIKYLSCPGQNPVFASKNGDIGIWQQGDFPAKWRRQGDFIMPGQDSSFAWKGVIPQAENPHMKNPVRGYVSSANQLSVGPTYPYYTGNSFPVYRGYIINRYLDHITDATVEDMKRMQVDNYNVKAELARDLLMRAADLPLGNDEQRFFDYFRSWNLRNDPAESGATVFAVWWQELEKAIWSDEINKSGLPLPWPNESTLIESLRKKDTAYRFIDDITTTQKETLTDILQTSLKKATERLKEIELLGKIGWANYRETKVQHLLKLPAFSQNNVYIGGGRGIINATLEDHGPSWRMVVHLATDTEAYGVYPGGQSGNPGSRYYDNFIDTWARGDYYTLWIMKKTEMSDPRVKWVMKFSPVN